MRNEEFLKLRKEKKFSQERLAKELLIPVSSIRKWERRMAIPSLDKMKQMAKVFGVDETIIVNIFKPEKTRVSEQLEISDKMYNLFNEIFWETQNGQNFVSFCYLLSLSKVTCGVISCENFVFPFTRVFAERDGYAAVLADDMDNFCVFTLLNILDVTPVSINYDVYSLQVTTCCPIFPTDEKNYSNVFTQAVKISFFTEKER